MRTIRILFWIFSISVFAQAQNNSCNYFPPTQSVRTMAEWEEIKALCISWQQEDGSSSNAIFSKIVDFSKNECEVIIFCDNPNSVKAVLTANQVDYSQNVTFIQSDLDSKWIRDYGANTVYLNDVDSLALVDWQYNRPFRIKDDNSALIIAQYFNLPLYCTSEELSDYFLVHTGGNFVPDGLGNAFSSKLILHENATYTPQNIQTILGDFMGIQQLILLDTLWYDIIHHVDMHMKLLDEETMMVGQYPLNTADGPQIEANLQYILSNFVNPYGKPYRIIRIPMPPENGQFPNNGGDYRTYTNTVFVNNTILVPTYNSPYDSAALQIWQHNMKGYNVRGIDCNAIIPQRGALHCITKEVGTSDPIWITFEKFDSIVPHNENGYPFRAKIKHKTGIASASLYYQTEKRSLFQELPLNLQEENIYTAIIPPQNEGTTINYYVGAVANNGKQAQRPMTSPEGALQFQIEETSNAIVIQTANTINVYPNPAKAVTCIEWESLNKQAIEINLTDVLGTKMETIFQGNPFGKNRFFFNTANYPSGIYFINIFENNNFITAAKIVIR